MLDSGGQTLENYFVRNIDSILSQRLRQSQVPPAQENQDRRPRTTRLGHFRNLFRFPSIRSNNKSSKRGHNDGAGGPHR